MTAHAVKGAKDECLEAGMDNYVTKPINPEDLARAIEGINIDDSQIQNQDFTDKKEVFDKETLKKRLDIDDAMVKEIMDVFLKDTPTQINRLKEAFQLKDAQMVKRHAHTIKGATANFCAGLMNKTAKNIEEAALREDFELIEKLINILGSQFEIFKKVLEEQ